MITLDFMKAAYIQQYHKPLDYDSYYEDLAGPGPVCDLCGDVALLTY